MVEDCDVRSFTVIPVSFINRDRCGGQLSIEDQQSFLHSFSVENFQVRRNVFYGLLSNYVSVGLVTTFALENTAELTSVSVSLSQPCNQGNGV